MVNKYISPDVYARDYWFLEKGNFHAITRRKKISKIFQIDYKPIDVFKVPVGNTSPKLAKKSLLKLIQKYKEEIM